MLRFVLSTFVGVAAGFGSLPSSQTALLVIDVQDCFLEATCTSTGAEGSLSVPGCGVIDKINQIRAEKGCLFDEVIFTRDFHPAGHISFGSTHGLAPFSHLGGLGALPLMCTKPESGLTADGECCPTHYIEATDCESVLCPATNYSAPDSIVVGNTACEICASDPGSCFETEQAMWTDHCLQDGDSTFPSALDIREDDMIVKKGMHKFVDAYSAFMDNTATLKTELDQTLIDKGITRLIVTGIATDVCVLWTVNHALGDMTAPYEVLVVSDATAPVLGDMANFNSSIMEMEAGGATIMETDELLSFECPV